MGGSSIIISVSRHRSNDADLTESFSTEIISSQFANIDGSKRKIKINGLWYDLRTFSVDPLNGIIMNQYGSETPEIISSEDFTASCVALRKSKSLTPIKNVDRSGQTIRTRYNISTIVFGVGAVDPYGAGAGR